MTCSVPPLRASVPLAKPPSLAVVFPRSNVPPPSVVPPAELLVPLRTNVPALIVDVPE